MYHSEKKQPAWVRRKLALLRAVIEIERKRADVAEGKLAKIKEWVK